VDRSAPAGVPQHAADHPAFPSEQVGAGELPAWVAAELPPAYADLARQIAALREEARRFEDIAGVLWQTGPPLMLSVRHLFAALGFETDLAVIDRSYSLRVSLDGQRRLLVEAAGDIAPLQRKSPPVSRLLRALQEDAGEHDRLVLAVNAFCDLPLDARRGDPVAPDALRLLQRLGANVVTTATLFGLWKYSLTDVDAARRSILQLHGQDGGIYR
jgi:hypothetical protein